MAHFFFTLDKETLNRLDWHSGSDQPDLTDEQAQIIAVASIASALDNIALQLNQALGPLQEIADNLRREAKD